ncbi:uncharacterized protein LOC132057630 [Lycium ferocissimum]|uniref:uncharacterized protein LOC132057630 n=1 Tax=Lycium ferocissimum TaxID=112874 RepID=UPI00281615A3|nr:uncharacterized protein LOC132057630 [Lycium ferocissimum]
MERVEGLRNGNRAEGSNSISVSKGLQDDLIVGEIVSRLPLKFAVQCKIVSKNFNRCISDPKFSQTLLQREMDCSTQLIYTSNGSMRKFHKISLNHIPTTQRKTTLPDDVEVLASCKGLILLDFEETKVYCIFNPITGTHQLIPYPEPTTFMMIGFPGLAVDYSSSDQYTLVTISKLAENPNLFYKFHVLSSKQPGLWREFQLRSNTFSDLAVGCPPVYWCNSLYWLRSDGSVIAYDTEKEEAIILDRPEFIDHSDNGKILIGRDIWLGVAQGLLTLVCIFEKSIVIASYDNSSNWNVYHKLENFISSSDGIINGFPVLIDSKQVLFVVEHPPAMYDLYEYDIEISEYRKAPVLNIVNYPLHSFEPTLASVHATPSEIVNTHHLSYIAAKLDVFRRFITEGVSHQEEEEEEEESSSSSSSSSLSEEEEAIPGSDPVTSTNKGGRKNRGITFLCHTVPELSTNVAVKKYVIDIFRLFNASPPSILAVVPPDEIPLDSIDLLGNFCGKLNILHNMVRDATKPSFSEDCPTSYVKEFSFPAS